MLSPWRIFGLDSTELEEKGEGSEENEGQDLNS